MDNDFYIEQEKIDKVEVINQVETPEIQKVEVVNPTEQIEVQKVEVINKDKPIKVQKVEVTNQPEIKVEKIDLNVLERKVDKLTDVMSKVIDAITKIDIKPEVNVETNDIQLPEVQKVDMSLPRGKDGKADYKKANPREYLIVRMSDGEKFIDGSGSAVNASATGELIWLREEYTFTTVSGQQVPTKVVKYTDLKKVTEDITYDANANPIMKLRKVESI